MKIKSKFVTQKLREQARVGRTKSQKSDEDKDKKQ